MAKIALADFFKWFDETNVNHLEAVVLLESMMDPKLLRDASAWVRKYREPLPEPEAPPWPITKEQLGYIMQCSSETLNDALINDLAKCVADCEMDQLELVYFLGQCGHESAGLRYPVEIHDGSNYEGREDLGNTTAGWGVKYAGTGWIQVTGAYWHRKFSEHIGDPKVFELGKTYTSEKYPWSIAAFWWLQNGMKEMCAARKECTDYQIDEIGARVNGRMRPNGADDRIAYTDRAYKTIIGV